jgi:hypothetical protein
MLDTSRIPSGLSRTEKITDTSGPEPRPNGHRRRAGFISVRHRQLPTLVRFSLTRQASPAGSHGTAGDHARQPVGCSIRQHAVVELPPRDSDQILASSTRQLQPNIRARRRYALAGRVDRRVWCVAARSGAGGDDA